MVLKTEQAPLGNAFQVGAAGLVESNVEGSDSFEMVENASINVTSGEAKPTNVQGPCGPAEPIGSEDRLRGQIQDLRQQLSRHRAENITLEIKSGQLERDNEELSIELSRTRLTLAREKASAQRLKMRYDDLLEECSLSGDKLSKKMAKDRKQADETQQSLQQEVEDQKKYWQEINQQLTKENEEVLRVMAELKTKLEEARAQHHADLSKNDTAVSKLQREVDDALEAKSKMQIELERTRLDNGKLRQEKTDLEHQYEERLSKLSLTNNPAATIQEDFGTDEMLKMMQDTLGVDAEELKGY